MKFKSGEIYIASGEFEFKILKGKAELVGSIIQEGESQYIPVGKSIPIEVIEDCEIEILKGGETNLRKIESRTIPPEWDRLIQRITEQNLKKVIVLGEMDTGKSFFTTYVANKIVRSGKKVGVIDSDVGQSDIGPPGAIGMTVLDKPVVFLGTARVDYLEFVGSHSPGLHIIPLLTSFLKMVRNALADTEFVIVNTDGWVHGDGGRNIKQAMIEILDPDIVVLMQRENECEPLVASISENKIVRMKVSRKASETSKGEREKLRNLASQRYFSNSKEYSYSFDDFVTERCYFKTGEEIKNPSEYFGISVIYAEKYPAFEGYLLVSKNKLTTEEKFILYEKGFKNFRIITPKFLKGILVGLLDENRKTVGLGIIKEVDFENRKLSLITPGEGKEVKIIQFGSLRYTLEGKENGFVEPGAF